MHLTDSRSHFTLALTGDTILNRRISDIKDDDAQAVLEVLRTADLAFSNCETLFHDYVGPEVYPAVEGGWSYMRSPGHIAEEMRKLGFGLMATANNHMLDYSYGGMFSTHAALTAAGIEHAGSGRDLPTARAPAFADVGGMRIALVSMTSSSTVWCRAGMPHDGIPGRPGVNPLRFHFTADSQTMAQIIELHTRLGWWISKVGEREWEINPPGLHHSVTRYFEVDEPGTGMVLDADDVAGNLRAIRSAKAQADLVIVHVHNHEWDQERGTAYPPAFLPKFARAALDAGGDVFFAQGSHAPLRGVEIYGNKPIFYDTGDLFAMSSMITRFPYDFYSRHAPAIKGPIAEALPVDGLAARSTYLVPKTVNPPGGYQQGRRRAGVIPVLHYNRKHELERIEINPFVHKHATKGELGVPFRASAEVAELVISDLSSLSETFGTEISFADGKGHIAVGTKAGS